MAQNESSAGRQLWFDPQREHFYLVPRSSVARGGPFELRSLDGQMKLVDLRDVQPFEISATQAKQHAHSEVDRFFDAGEVSASGGPVLPGVVGAEQLYASLREVLARLGSASDQPPPALLPYLQELVGMFDGATLSSALQKTCRRLSERAEPLDLAQLVDVVQALMDEELAGEAEPELPPDFGDRVRAEARASINAALRRRGFDVDD
jgi:hypothetical protein